MTGEPETHVVPRPEDRVGLMQVVGDPEEATLWEHVRPRKLDDEQWRRFEGYIAEIFGAFGMELDRPLRFIRSRSGALREVRVHSGERGVASAAAPGRRESA
ncbi:MAG: hypothetical protein ACT4PO_03685 [Actinomycetota bacterium]